MKDCSKCKVSKPLEDFAKDKSVKNGRKSQCKECRKVISKQEYISNPTQHKIRTKNYYNSHKEQIKEWGKEYDKLPERKAYRKAYMQKMRQDPFHRIKDSVLSMINYHLPKKSKQTNEYLGCSYEEYFVYLEAMFTEDMTWENYGTYWEIDHTHPLSKGGSFHYTNTTPMTIIENRKKGNKIV